MRVWLTVATFVILFGLSRRFGKGPEQQVAAILLVNFLLLLLYLMFHGWVKFDQMDRGLALLDFVSLGGFLWVALRANRIWPLSIAALQVVVMIAHLSVFVEFGAKSVYWGMMAIAQYLQLVVLAGGIIMHHRRERRVGPYRSWRPSFPA